MDKQKGLPSNKAEVGYGIMGFHIFCDQAFGRRITHTFYILKSSMKCHGWKTWRKRPVFWVVRSVTEERASKGRKMLFPGRIFMMWSRRGHLGLDGRSLGVYP